MNEHPDDCDENFFFKLGHSLGSTRSGQFVISLAVAAFFSGLAYMAWHMRDLAAYVLTLLLLGYGFQLAWRFLPISSATRARWDREEKLLQHCPASRCRYFLWYGIVILMMQFLRIGSDTSFYDVGLLMPGSFIVVGAGSYLLCHRFIRRERNA